MIKLDYFKKICIIFELEEGVKNMKYELNLLSNEYKYSNDINLLSDIYSYYLTLSKYLEAMQKTNNNILFILLFNKCYRYNDNELNNSLDDSLKVSNNKIDSLKKELKDNGILERDLQIVESLILQYSLFIKDQLKSTKKNLAI